MSNRGRYFSAQEAAQALGVTAATLYAYTSRGQLHSEPVPGRPRERRYHREDIMALRDRKEARRDPAKAAARGLHWGSPVLDSGITLIHNGKLYYRGQDAVKLAGTASLEQVAALLWAADAAERPRLFEQPCALPARQLARLRECTKDPITLLQAALPLAGSADLASYDLRPAAVRQTGARILRLLTMAVAADRGNVAIHRALAAGWARKTLAAENAIRTALVVSADHELNVSAFTARCAASAGAPPYDAISAAMATLKGHKHGGATKRVSALLAEINTPRRARAVLADRLRRGEHIPGFGHPLYPNGDPRAAVLLRLAATSGSQTEWRLVTSLGQAGWELLQEHPNLDFALVAVARTHRLPRDAPLILFVLGRTAGWIGHMVEQYAIDELIRPRARYTGPAPVSSEIAY